MALKIYTVSPIHSLFYFSEFPDKYLLTICVNVCVGYQVQLFVTPRTIAFRALLSMEFSSQKYWNGSALQETFLTQGLNPCLLHPLLWQEDSLPYAT